MRVQATKEGFYRDILRPPGEVFDLDTYSDGTFPIRMRRTYKIDKDGKENLDEWTDEPWLDSDGNAVHAHFAPDDEWIEGKGNFRGEQFVSGWMRAVPETTPLGIYENPIFSGQVEQERPISRVIKPSDRAVNAPRISVERPQENRPRRTG